MNVTRHELLNIDILHYTGKFLDWFDKEVPSGEISLQSLLNKLAKDDMPRDAIELMYRFESKTENTSVVMMEATDSKHLFVAGDLVCSKDIEVKNIIACSGSIIVNGKIKAGTSIRVNKNLIALKGIEAGTFITAGLGVYTEEELKYTTALQSGFRSAWYKQFNICHVISKNKPDNIPMLSEWIKYTPDVRCLFPKEAPPSNTPYFKRGELSKQIEAKYKKGEV